ncbi:hypothetical protein LDENG_00003260 [Lucifuga dentata]|nr:hypothetical protein LDENG_00003260 [Lucifuga dentata]
MYFTLDLNSRQNLGVITPRAEGPVLPREYFLKDLQTFFKASKIDNQVLFKFNSGTAWRSHFSAVTFF